MLEATYGIVIGDVDNYDNKIIDKYPESVGKNRIVEHGCGRCTSHNSCEMLIPLTCLVCEYFKTTIEHEPFFIKAIDRIDQMILEATTPHDVEDLTTIKRLHVLYLRAIYKKKEGLIDAAS